MYSKTHQSPKSPFCHQTILLVNMINWWGCVTVFWQAEKGGGVLGAGPTRKKGGGVLGAGQVKKGGLYRGTYLH